MATETDQHFLTLDNINPNIQKFDHPIRGPLMTRIKELEKELENVLKHKFLVIQFFLNFMFQDISEKPFKEIIKPLVADCQAMGHQPITFIRQVMAIVVYSQLLDDTKFPDDAKERARTILKACNGGSIGSYTDTKGIDIIRKHVAEFIEKRDGIPSSWEDIILCTGQNCGLFFCYVKLMIF